MNLSVSGQVSHSVKQSVSQLVIKSTLAECSTEMFAVSILWSYQCHNDLIKRSMTDFVYFLDKKDLLHKYSLLLFSL